MMMKSYFTSTIIELAAVLVTATATSGASTAYSSSLRGAPVVPAASTAASAVITTSTLLDSNERIVGGDRSDEGEFPYFVEMGGW
jgi:hypothetical protein